MLQPLPHDDVDALLRLWPEALTCPSWRLCGESPSVGLLDEVRSGVEHERVLRDHTGLAIGLLQVREVDHASGSGYLSFVLASAEGAVASLPPFADEALAALRLRKLTVLADDDMLDALAGLRPRLRPVGLLTAHVLATTGCYVDRHVFDLDAESA